jgi:acyl-homoserine lactone acylase PvdQ
VAKLITVPYRTATGMDEREFTVYETHHGPVVRAAEDGRWVSIRLMEEPLKALTQSYSRTKARNYAEYLETMRLHTNSSNNTIFADAEGNIAYFHSNFVPERNTSFDWARPVDGSDPATEWSGIHEVEESPNVLNPVTGWIQNTNNWPYSVSGPASPDEDDYPAYMDRSGENARGRHAIMVLDGKTDFTLSSLIDSAYDSYLPAFEDLIPTLVQAYDRTADTNPLKAQLAEPMEVLREWDFRWGVESVPTSLGIFFGEQIQQRARAAARESGMAYQQYLASPESAPLQMEAMAAAVARLEEDFGDWRTPWGEINRFQRLTGDIVQPFDDDAPSIPVGFTSGRWGSLASYGARRFNTRKFYGTSGNSFVAVVEFGDRVRARAITAGGLSGDPDSPHFDDQAERYATGDLREVYFYPEQLEGHVEREYHPGG